MIKTKKISMILLILMFALTSFLFVACGKADYSKTYLSASHNYLELYKDDEKNLSITIKNPAKNMSKKLEYSLSDPNVCDIEIVSQYEMTTTFMVSGKNGGNTTIDFISKEGGKTLSVNIYVKEYSSTIKSEDHGLYVSETSKLSPSSSDFYFENANAGERDLSFYFYGKDLLEGENLTLEDVSSGGVLVNEFTDVELYKFNDKFYLIFADKDGFFHTIGNLKYIAGSDNVTYQFISATRVVVGEDVSYKFDTAVAESVYAGDEFTFLAKYRNEITEEELYCERTFSVIIDINEDDVSHEYGYKIVEIDYENGVDNTSYKIDDHKNGSIALIPNYTAPIKNNVFLSGYNSNYLTAYVEIKVNNVNDFLQVNIQSKDPSVASAKISDIYKYTDYTMYYVEVNCSAGIKQNTSLEVNLCYKGFENNNDDKVNYTYSIPVEIRIKPTQLLVNNVDLSLSSKVYKFYNSYVLNEDYGWQPFNFTITPEGAEYDKLYIDLTDSDLQAKYGKNIYTTGVVEITNLNETLFLKGRDGVALAENKKLPINLDFNIIQEDTISSKLEYSIIKGPSPLDFKTSMFENKISIERNGGEVVFTDIYTDAEFSSIKFVHDSGDDVVGFKYDSLYPYVLEGKDYKLNLVISPKNVGFGSYVITIDNGQSIILNIEVKETLKTLSLTTKDENNIVSLLENNHDGENTSLIYLYHIEDKTNFDLTLIANGSVRSNAIEDIMPVIDSPYISISQMDNINSFMVYVNKVGSLSFAFTVQACQIENFVSTNVFIDYRIEIVSFSYLENLNVYKLNDGYGSYDAKTSASYAYVYSNTYNESARKLKLEVSIKNPEAYLFANPATNKFEDSTYEDYFLYIESDSIIYHNGNKVDIMYFSSTQSNVYTIGDYGSFDTDTLTFTAFSNLENNRSLKLIAHVKQYGKTYSFTINVNIQIYEVVEGVTLQDPTITGLEFSALAREKSIIAYPTNKTATNGEIVALFVGGEIGEAPNIYTILDENSISYLESDGKTYISIKVSEDFLKAAETYTGAMTGNLIIVAKDWLDNGGNIRSEYQELALPINIRFANGTEFARFTIKDAQDIVNMKENLSAHYQISTTIDVSSITHYLPIGELKGSIVGVNEYAIITNINITNPFEVDDKNYYGLFTKIAEGAYIEYIQFEGSFKIEYNEGASCIGLLAAENNGKLINVGSKIGLSNVNMQYGNFGGLVGVNNGEIIQDFTLFEVEDADSKRTNSLKELQTVGRYSYQNQTPLITVQMTDFVNVYYKVENSLTSIHRIGGLVGYNTGTIKKVDSQDPNLLINGYLNYFGYSLIKSQPSNNLATITKLSNAFTGGLIGEAESSASGKIIACYNIIDPKSLKPVPETYQEYKNASETTFEAGQGIVVGGEVWGYGYVGGVIGKLSNLSSEKDFAGVTSRTFVRGQKVGNTVANIALIANIASINNHAGLSTSFAIQAVDDGKIGEESSMAILYNGVVDTSLQGYVNDVNKLGFGNFDNGIGVLNGYREEINASNPVNVFTYVISRQLMQMEMHDTEEYVTVENSNKSTYYGDFIILGTNAGTKRVIAQKLFTEGDDIDLSISAKYNNQMQSNSENAKSVYYAYYFQVASTSDETQDLSTIQSLLDSYLNKISLNNALYPFIANGEMIFSSKTPDILTIDQTGKLTIKKTGLALISASSVLNTNNALNFYIYVVNYFNPESTFANDERNSIIYNDISASSLPVDVSNIELRGNNSAELFIRPLYNLDLEMVVNLQGNFTTLRFNSDKFGRANFSGLVFNLAENTIVSALISVSDSLGNDVDDSLDIEVIGQSINIRKNEKTTEDSYSLTITPVLTLSIDNDKYLAQVNKEITNTTVNYKLGATDIINVNYNSVPIQTSKPVNDIVVVNSTDENEHEPLYYIVGLDGTTKIQGNIPEFEYQLSSSDFLFNVGLTSNGEKEDLGNNIYRHKFNLSISVNRNSNVYTNRYNKEIYGKYRLYIQPNSNSNIFTCIEIEFERTEISAVVIDNYKSLNEMDGTSLSSTSDYAYPGEQGLLAITISPEDSDFDYVLIENADQNYQSGRATSVFSLSARLKNASSDKLFDSSKIVGSSTSKGLKLTQDEIIKIYDDEAFINYNGVFYINYSMSSKNVTDLSVSRINITFFKDGSEIFSTYKDLKVKLKTFVAIEIEGKEGDVNQSEYYKAYDVARGMKYKLNINSFGFRQESITVLKSSNEALGRITKENGDYYLTITSNEIDYSNLDSHVFELVIEAEQNAGENIRQAGSKTKITVFEFVLDYDYQQNADADIVSNAGDGIINVQVGSYIDLDIDLYDFIEYNSSISGVVNSVEKFLSDLETEGNWYAFTNLISDEQPDYERAPEHNLEEVNDGYLNLFKDNDKVYKLGSNTSIKNYFFSSSGLRIQPTRTHIPEETFYYFGYVGKFKEQNGTYVASNGSSDAKIMTKFAFNVYSTSSEESPIPIYDYEDLCKMQKGGYYILLNDITLPNVANEENGVSAFVPLKGDFSSLDGNGHAINFAGTYDMGGLSEIGIFSSLEEGSLIKNLIVNFTSATDGSDINSEPNDKIYALEDRKIVRFITTADSFVFGSIVAENSGIITNCQVYSEKTAVDEYFLTVKADNALTGSSYIGGLVGRNSGFITNCGVSLNIKAPYNIGGVVAQNYNKVAGCYFKEGKLINNSQYAQYAAGFAVTNSLDAQIMTSYVAGAQSRNNLYSQDSNSYITSTIIGAGFILENLGKINDCYTDIDLSKTTAEMAGFAYRNSGTIKNSFSLSVLRNNTTASAGFVKEESVLGITGSLVNCYYYYHIKNGANDVNINTSLYDATYEGVEALTADQFANFEEYFSDYSYESGMSVNSIWFVANGNTSSNFVEYIPTTQKIVIEGENGNSQSNTIYQTEIMEFATGRLELVSPNIRVLSIQNFDYSDVDDATGNVTYHYKDDSSTPNRGSIHNPRLIYSAQSMENEILNSTASNNLNSTNYRLISDVNYNDFEGHSALYKVKFAGVLEGNGMRVSGISLVSMESLDSAGMFAQIGYSQSKQGAVKNLTISPRAVSFNSANSVGILAGTIKYGYVYDVVTESVQGSSSTVIGLKFVGGVFGRAISSFTIKDVYSSANVSANYSPDFDITYTEGDTGGSYSYAGSIGGFVGNGKLYNAHVSNVESVMGGRAGYAYGGIGRGADVKYTFVTIKPSASIKPYQYGGFVAGEIGGNLIYAYVSDNGGEATFSNIPKVANAVGGITGRFNGGLISNALMQQDFRCNTTESNQTVLYVGGLVGWIYATDATLSKIENCVVDANISAGNTLGGGVGRITSAAQIDVLAIKSNQLSISGQRANPCLGGIVGSVTSSGASLEMSNSYCNATLNIKTNTPGVESTAFAGGLIGDAKTTPRLYYCYTTSQINAEVYDSRQVSGLIDYKDIEEQEYKDYISYEHKVVGGYNQVYFYGTGNAGADKSVYVKPYVNFTTKAKSVSIKLTVSNFGESKDSTSSLNNIFDQNYQVASSNASILNLKKTAEGYLEETGLFEKDDNFGLYYREEKISVDTLEDLTTVGNADVKTYYIVDGEKYEYLTRIESGGNQEYILKNVETSKEKSWNGIDKFEDIALSQITKKRFEFNENCLQQNTVYRGNDGNYYLKSATGKISGTYTYACTNIKTGQVKSSVILESLPIWQGEINTLSSLSIENQFDWLDMK